MQGKAGKHLNHPVIQLFSRMYSIAPSKASYFKPKVNLLSYVSSNSETLSSLTPSIENPCYSCLLMKGSNPTSFIKLFSCIYSLLRQKSMQMFCSDFSTCLRKLSTVSFNTLKTFIVPSTSKHLLPIAIIAAPKKIHDLSSNSFPI